MKIKWLEFENWHTGLKIERIYFNDDITLLVGLSGVGKTQILRAIEYSLELATNKNIRLMPYHVSLGIEVNEKNYVWEYDIKSDKKHDLIGTGNEKYYFSLEKLSEGDAVLFNRTENSINIIGYQKIPTPKTDESLLIQFAQDEVLKEFITEIRKIVSIETEIGVHIGIEKKNFITLKSEIKEIILNDKNVNFVMFSQLPVVMKIYIVKKFYPELYYKIFEAVKELFMEIQDIDVVEDTSIEMYLIAIKVYDKVLLQHEISNGMLKTIYYIVELFTMSENSLVLIDEFENGLGVNCIDLLSEMLITERKDLQFIITSHHPKIIGGIDKGRWKIIDRDISVIKNVDSAEYGIGNSQHDAYFNLLSRWEFEGKI